MPREHDMVATEKIITMNKPRQQTCCDKPPKMARRWLLTACGTAVLAFAPWRSKTLYASQRTLDPILQPELTNALAFIERAFEMRRLATDYGDQAYGAVIVRDDVIIGQSWSRVIIDQDPTAHAEMSAIRDAARRSNSRDLHGAVIYSSSRPCPMCEAAAYWAGIDQMIHGHGANNAGPPQLCR